MADKRFSWSRATELEVIYELKRRSLMRVAMPREVGKKCVVASCHKSIRAKDRVYVPAFTPNADNEVIAHADCLEAAYAGAKKDGKAASIKLSEHKGMIKLASDLDIQAFIKQIYQKGFEAGKRAGQRELYTQLESAVLGDVDLEVDLLH